MLQPSFNPELMKRARENLTIYFVLALAGLIIASFDQLILGAVCVAVAGYFCSLVKDDRPSLLQLLSFYPFWKWFSAIYMLGMSALALHYMSELSEIVMHANPLALVVVIFFPILVPWIRHEYLLFRQSK